MQEGVKKYQEYQAFLSNHSPLKGQFFEIDYRYQILKGELFSMQPNFMNFDTVDKNQLIANSNHTRVYAPFKGRIFMPLYQQQGDDGFFIIREIKIFWLKLFL